MSEADLFDTGSLAYEQGDYSRAIDCFEQLIRNEPSAEAWLLLAECHAESGAGKKAYECLKKGLAAFPQDMDLLFALGDYYFETGADEQALQIYQQIIDQHPQEAEALVCKAMVLMNQKKIEAATAVCQDALQIQPDMIFALNALGDIYSHQGRLAEAIGLYRQATTLDPEDAQPLLNLADALYEDGKLEEAEQCCLKGLALDSGMTMGYFLLGSICLDQDRTREAVEYFEQFLRLEKSPSAEELRKEVAAVLEGLK
ncbi:MAG: tetratricopeptide repeat protein [Pelovirga sp.]